METMKLIPRDWHEVWSGHTGEDTVRIAATGIVDGDPVGIDISCDVDVYVDDSSTLHIGLSDFSDCLPDVYYPLNIIALRFNRDAVALDFADGVEVSISENKSTREEVSKFIFDMVLGPVEAMILPEIDTVIVY